MRDEALHWVMFQPNIVSLCDEEQQSRWLPLCRDWKMIGCYAQTELGHGSNIRALETTATFLPESKGGQKGGSWVINSPTLTSGKFWPGTLGRTANVSGKPHGLQFRSLLQKHNKLVASMHLTHRFSNVGMGTLFGALAYICFLSFLPSLRSAVGQTTACHGDCAADRWRRETPRDP